LAAALRLEIRQPLSFYGTSLVEQISTRKGISRIISGLDKFPSLRDLEVGAALQGKVEWVYESGKHATWDVSITISDEARRRTNPSSAIFLSSSSRKPGGSTHHRHIKDLHFARTVGGCRVAQRSRQLRRGGVLADGNPDTLALNP